MVKQPTKADLIQILNTTNKELLEAKNALCVKDNLAIERECKARAEGYREAIQELISLVRDSFKERED